MLRLRALMAMPWLDSQGISIVTPRTELATESAVRIVMAGRVSGIPYACLFAEHTAQKFA